MYNVCELLIKQKTINCIELRYYKVNLTAKIIYAYKRVEASDELRFYMKDIYGANATHRQPRAKMMHLARCDLICIFFLFSK